MYKGQFMKYLKYDIIMWYTSMFLDKYIIQGIDYIIQGVDYIIALLLWLVYIICNILNMYVIWAVYIWNEFGNKLSH